MWAITGPTLHLAERAGARRALVSPDDALGLANVGTLARSEVRGASFGRPPFPSATGTLRHGAWGNKGNDMIALEPIGYVRDARAEAVDDNWGLAESRIVLTDAMGDDALDGIEAFSHAEIVYFFDRVSEDKIQRGARHPRNNTSWPKVGILAQRGKNRPNRLGSTIVRVLKREGKQLWVLELDAIEGTPVLDIKPVMQEFLPRSPVTQPDWSRELMAEYWAPGAQDR